MLVLKDKPTVMFDTDETIVTWRQPPGEFPPQAIEIDVGQGPMVVWPHEAHIDRLKNHYRIGHQVVVWSHGGSAWAAAVVQALGLEPYVHVVCAKGSWFYDDKPQDIITEYSTRYIQPGAYE